MSREREMQRGSEREKERWRVWWFFPILFSGEEKASQGPVWVLSNVKIVGKNIKTNA